MAEKRSEMSEATKVKERERVSMLRKKQDERTNVDAKRSSQQQPHRTLQTLWIVRRPAASIVDLWLGVLMFRLGVGVYNVLLGDARGGEGGGWSGWGDDGEGGFAEVVEDLIWKGKRGESYEREREEGREEGKEEDASKRGEGNEPFRPEEKNKGRSSRQFESRGPGLQYALVKEAHPDPRSSTGSEVKSIGHLVAERRDKTSPIEELYSSFKRDGGHSLSLVRA